MRRTLLGLYVAIEPAIRNVAQAEAGGVAFTRGATVLAVVLITWAAVDLGLKAAAGFLILRRR